MRIISLSDPCLANSDGDISLGLPVFPEEANCSFCRKLSNSCGDHVLCACHTSGGIVQRQDLIRDAIFDTALTALLRPKREENYLLDRKLY